MAAIAGPLPLSGGHPSRYGRRKRPSRSCGLRASALQARPRLPRQQATAAGRRGSRGPVRTYSPARPVHFPPTGRRARAQHARVKPGICQAEARSTKTVSAILRRHGQGKQRPRKGGLELRPALLVRDISLLTQSNRYQSASCCIVNFVEYSEEMRLRRRTGFEQLPRESAHSKSRP